MAMPGVELKDLNWIAIGGAALFNMVLGSVWYNAKSPTGRVWLRGQGLDPATLERPSGALMARSIGLALVGAFVMMFVFAHTFVAYHDAYRLDEAAYKLSALDAVVGAFMTWLGFFVPVLWGSVLWERRPWSFFLVNAGYWLLSLLVAAFAIVYIPK